MHRFQKSASVRKISRNIRKISLCSEKSASVSNNSAPFRDASIPTDLNVTNPAKNHSQFWWRPIFFFFFFLETTCIWAKKTFESPISAEKSLSILVKTFFFCFFGDHLNLGEKNVWISDFGRKITLNCGEDIRIFEVLCFKSPPTKIFWIRHWVRVRYVGTVRLSCSGTGTVRCLNLPTKRFWTSMKICDERAWSAQSLGYSQVIVIAS